MATNCSHTSPKQSSSPEHLRIISFAPSITESLFALGLGNNVVGVTNYCTYPPAVKRIPSIGGYVDPNYEMILRLRPDMVIMLQEHGPLIEFLKKNSIRFVTIQNENVASLLNSFPTIAGLCGVKERGDSLASQLGKQLTCEKDSGKKPRILFCIGRDNPGSGLISKVYVAGPKTLYSELMDAAGGVNAYSDSSISYPTLSAEGIARLSPDILLDCMSSVPNIVPEKAERDWKQLTVIPAVRTGNIYCLTGDYITIPGPRIVQTYHDLQKIILDWRRKTL